MSDASKDEWKVMYAGSSWQQVIYLERLVTDQQARIAELEKDLADSKHWRHHWKNESSTAKQQLAELREALKEAAEGFEAAEEGHGVNFYLYAAEIRALLESSDE